MEQMNTEEKKPFAFILYDFSKYTVQKVYENVLLSEDKISYVIRW